MRASALAIPRGVQLRIEDFDAVEIQVERDASIEGEIVFPGGLLRIAAENIRLVGSINVSGVPGGRGVDGQVSGEAGPGGAGGSGGGPPFVLPGRSGGGGSGGNGGTSEVTAGIYAPNGPNGAFVFSPGFPGARLYSLPPCGYLPGGAAGGTNGTRGAGGPSPTQPLAQPFGAFPGGHYYSAQPISDPAVSPNSPVAGGGSGASGGCGTSLIDRYTRTLLALAGAGGGGGGGGGGGTVVLEATNLTVDGDGVQANGGPGGDGGNGGGPRLLVSPFPAGEAMEGARGGGGAGGGAGGNIILSGRTINIAGPLRADGGRGGNGGIGAAGINKPSVRSSFGPGGGGGRIGVYSAGAISGITPSGGANATGQDGGTATIAFISARITNTPAGYIPTNSLKEDCSLKPGCREQFTVIISPPTVSGTITFRLADPPSARGRPKGYATSACFSPDCTDPLDTAPDYYFEASQQPAGAYLAPSSDLQVITTAQAVSAASVVVTSRDYGGSTRISAQIAVNGIIFPAAVQETGELFARVPLDLCNAERGCWQKGNTSDPELYANGIPDTWESARLPENTYFGRNTDTEAGPGSTPGTHGDGFGAHDEYRGFVYWTGVKEEHDRTDPVNTRNLFFYDASADAANRVRAFLAPLLAPANIVMHQALPFDVDVSNLPNGDLRLNPLNRNSTGDTVGYALFLRGIQENGLAPPSCGGDVLGSAIPFNDGREIKLYKDRIQCYAGENNYDFDLLYKHVISHEVGHKLRRDHPIRTIAQAAPPNTTPQALQQSQYHVAAPPTSLLAWLFQHPHAGNNRRLEKLTVGGLLGLSNATGVSDTYLPVHPAGNPLPAQQLVYQVSLAAHQVVGPGQPLAVETHTGTIMDWTAGLHIVSWAFLPIDVLNFCARIDCQ